MPRKVLARQAPSARRPWTDADIKLLKQSAKSGLGGSRIAKQLKRTPGAIYQQASTLGIQLLGNRRHTTIARRR
jgi:hypothetical protein